MRIFSIHKSKSKKQISEKTPKLAAQKFLEKRKVGTVIYLHEHPSGKIHGPYRKEYDKNIMKGGLDVFDYRVDRPQNSRTLYPPVLAGTNQLIIKQTRVGFLSNEPRIFFGDNRKTDTADNHYYTYVCKNKDSDINNLISFIFILHLLHLPLESVSCNSPETQYFLASFLSSSIEIPSFFGCIFRDCFLSVLLWFGGVRAPESP